MNTLDLPATLVLAAASLLSLSPASAEGQLPSTPATADVSSSPHMAMARELVDILSRTESALQSCRDADSVKAALPVLQEQKQRLREAVAAQSKLPDPSDEELRAVSEQFADLFTSLAEAIRSHMHRLGESGLATPELEALMHMPGTDRKR